MSNIENTQFVVLSCDNYIESRVKTIESTWAKNTNHIFLVDSGGSDQKNMIGYNTEKSYEGIQQKYISFFKNYSFDDFGYYFFTDDDTFVNINNFNKIPLESHEIPFGIGRILMLNSDATDMDGNYTGTNVSRINGHNTALPLYYFSGGSGFIFSASTCNKIKNYLTELNDSDIPYSPFGDVSIGFWARSCGIKLEDNNNFWWSTHEDLSVTSEKYTEDSDVVTFHYVDTDTMRRYDIIYNTLE